MGYKKYLTDDEREKILSMKSCGNSIFEISKQIHRSRNIISKFIKDPKGYIENMMAQASKSTKAALLLQNLNDTSTSILINNTTIKKETSTPIKKEASTPIKKEASTPIKKEASTPIKKTPSKSNVTESQKRIVKKDYNSSSNKKLTEADLKKFNRVPVEHRAVIKFLIKKGIGPRFIFEDLQKVYEKSAPDLQSTLYWAKQYQQGRNTIFNESQAKLNLIKNSKIKSATNIKPIKKSPAASSSKTDVKKLFKFKFKPLKRLND